jgi:selenide,water dikinase
LAQVLRPLQQIFRPEDHPELLVGLGEPDDAAVWRLDGARGLVVTTDFFTPVVDDPYDYGAIAAANALSDLYAMGATPFLALNIAAVPTSLPADVVAEIFRGGAEKVQEAGAVVAGGHTVQDEEPKYGLVALGLCALDRMMTKAKARPGDTLFLTKPLGTGVTTTALKAGKATVEDADAAVAWMTRLNGPAASAATQSGVRAATDVTGFGLLGHGMEMAEASGVGLRLHLRSIPFLRGALRYVKDGFIPGGSADNRGYFGDRVSFDPSIDEYGQMLLFDAQTSGGLLLAVAEDRIEGFLDRASREGVPTWAIGEVEAGQGIRVLDSASASPGEADPGDRWDAHFIVPAQAED